MRQTLYLCFIFLCSTLAYGQNTIPNANFENWSGNTPTGWTVNNNGSYIAVTKVNDAYEGSHAVKGTVIQGLNTVTMSPMLQSMSGNYGFPVDAGFDHITFYYKSFLYAGDRFNVNVAIYNSNLAMVGGGSISLATSENNYTPLTIPIIHFAPGAAFANISFTLVDGQGMTNGHLLSWFQVDALEGPATSTGVSEDCPETTKPLLAYRPASHEFNLMAAGSGRYEIEGYLMNGQRLFSVDRLLMDREVVRITAPPQSTGFLLLHVVKDGIRVSETKWWME